MHQGVDQHLPWSQPRLRWQGGRGGAVPGEPEEEPGILHLSGLPSASHNGGQGGNCSNWSLAMVWPTRSYAALQAADLDWIVGPGYSSGGYILEKNNEKPTRYHEKPTWNHENP